MSEPHPFRAAVEAKDLEGISATLREDVELHSPVLFRGFEGRDAVTGILVHVAGALEDLVYTDEALGDGTVILRFKAMVGDLEIEGIDYLTVDEDNRVTDLTVFMRPMSALTAFNARMAESLGVELPSG